MRNKSIYLFNRSGRSLTAPGVARSTCPDDHRECRRGERPQPGGQMPKKSILISGVVASLLLLVLSLNLALATASTTLEWWTVGSGGGGSSAGGISLNGTIGQPLVGNNIAGNIEACSGFWECGGALALAPSPPSLYLPVVLKN